MMDDPAGAHGEIALLADFRLLLYLFIGFRLAVGIVYQPFLFERYHEDGSPAVVERGMSSFGDFRYFYSLAQLSDDDQWPYRDYWYEFPPVWSGLFIAVYRGMRALGAAEYRLWATVMGLILTAFDVGNLVLVRDLARRLHGEHTAAALPWIYTVLAAPMIFPWWNFETLVLFLMLLALRELVWGQERRSAALTAVGALAKYVPILILPAVWRCRDRRRAAQYTLIAVLIAALAAGVLIAWGGRMAVASLLAQANRASYQTVWALLDGNMRTGQFAPLEDRFDVETAFDPVGDVPVIPGWLRLIPFAGLGLFVYTRDLRRDEQGIVAFYALTLTLFILWAQGWSPQWALTLTPFILLNFPDRRGAMVCLLLGFMSLVEYPALFSQTAETDGAITAHLVPPYVAIILTRTALLVGLAAALYRLLTRQETAYEPA